MSFTNPDHVCINCMREKENNGVCPYCGFDESQYKPSPDHLPPRSILGGKYLTGRVLGQGGYGITYVAWELNLDLKLAIREYYPVGLVSRIGADPAVVICERQNATEQFQTGVSLCVEEAKKLTKFFSLPGIVSVRDFFYENGTAYAVMEFVEGETLKERVKRCGKMGARETIELFLPMMQSLCTIHASGLLHKDINPVNIIISPAGNAKLIDFAAAKCADAEQQVCHTPLSSTHYPAKEQFFKRGEKGPWSDIYALCGTIYYAITGIPPQEALERMMEDTLESPSALGAQITPAQEAALLKGLAIHPQDRWQTMRELIEALSAGDAAAPEPSANKITQKSSAGQDALPVAPTTALPSSADESGKTMMPTQPQIREKPQRAQKPPKPPKPEKAPKPEKPPKKHLIRPRWLRIVLTSVLSLVLLVLVFGVLVPSLPTKEEKAVDSFGISQVSQERFLENLAYPDIQGMDQRAIEQSLSLYLRKFVLVTLYSGSGQSASSFTSVGYAASSSGYFVCHAESVEDITRVSIRFWGGVKDFDATLIGVDPQTKLAVIRLDGWAERPGWEREPIWAAMSSDKATALLSLQCANTKDFDKPILGSEQSLDETYSFKLPNISGIFSAFATTSEGATKPGSGLLFDGGFIIGFEIPASLIDQPETKDGKPVRYWIKTGPINKIAETVAAEDPLYPSFGLTTTTLADQGSTEIHSADGAYVKRVQDGSPAQIAGIRAGDIITRCRLVKIDSRKSFSFFVWRLAVVGEPIFLEIDRDGQTIQLSVTPNIRNTVYPDEFK